MPEPPSPTLSSTSSFLPTTTLLAIPDGPIASTSKDARSHLTSILGGYPTFPPLPASCSSTNPNPNLKGSSHPKPEEITCGTCGNQIPLLTQVYCPPEGGENDRNVYVFACPRGSCQRKPNSVRAYRASVRNEVYAADAAEQKAKREKEEAERREREKVNPFSMNSTTNTGLPGGGLGSTLFGGSADGMPTFNPFSSVAASTAPTEAFGGLSLVGSGGGDKEKNDEDASPPPVVLVTSGPDLPGKTFAAPFPAYLPPQYLTTFDEYLPADPNALAGDTAQRVRQMSAQEAEDKEKELQAGKKAAPAAGGAGEQWEKVLPKGVDEVFERFLERLNRAEDGSGQVLRYDLGAVPLPYSSNSDLFKRLFKRDLDDASAQDEDDLEPNVNIFGKKYDPTGVVPACPRCGGKRTFEMQLVPGLIAELKTEQLSLTGEKKRRSKKKKTQTDEERRRELAVLLGRASAKDLPKSTTADAADDDRTPVEREEDELKAETGMEWGTIMVFGCERDCVGYGEEWVGVEWEEIQ